MKRTIIILMFLVGMAGFSFADSLCEKRGLSSEEIDSIAEEAARKTDEKLGVTKEDIDRWVKEVKDVIENGGH